MTKGIADIIKFIEAHLWNSQSLYAIVITLLVAGMVRPPYVPHEYFLLGAILLVLLNIIPRITTLIYCKRANRRANHIILEELQKIDLKFSSLNKNELLILLHCYIDNHPIFGYDDVEIHKFEDYKNCIDKLYYEDFLDYHQNIIIGYGGGGENVFNGYWLSSWSRKYIVDNYPSIVKDKARLA